MTLNKPIRFALALSTATALAALSGVSMATANQAAPVASPASVNPAPPATSTSKAKPAPSAQAALCPSDKILPSQKAYPTETLPNEKRSYKVWHTKNAARKDVVTTRSGLQYKVIQEGIEGGVSPAGREEVTVHYHGYFPNGEIFDSSYGRGEPSELPVNRVIKGWIEALKDMKVCEARTLYIPGKLAYGRKGTRDIPSNVTLVFNMQLIGVDKT